MNADNSSLKPILLTPEETAQFLRISTRTLFRWNSGGDMPEPVRPSEGTTRWVREEIETWVRNGCPKRKRDNNRGRKGIAMASIYKRGQDKKKKRTPWYIGYTDENGKRRTAKGFSDRGQTEILAGKLEHEVGLRIRGLIDP